MVTRKVLPNQVPMSWSSFTRWAPPFSIALDGFVSGRPRFAKKGPYRNLNHHEGVAPLETRATCAQALVLVRMGLLDEVFSEGGNPRATLFVNDCDEDVCTSDWILHNAPLVRSATNPLLNRMVYIEDMLDTTAGAYPFPTDLEGVKEMMWIFEPYHHFRVSGQIDRRDAGAFESVIVDVGERIGTYLAGRGGRVELDRRYKVVGGGKGWQLLEVIGLHGATGAFADGLRAFATVRERPDGRFVYSLRRSADFVENLPISRLVRHLNKVENCKSDCWGGRTTAAGSPRVSGSSLRPEQFMAEVASCQQKL